MEQGTEQNGCSFSESRITSQVEYDITESCAEFAKFHNTDLLGKELVKAAKGKKNYWENR